MYHTKLITSAALAGLLLGACFTAQAATPSGAPASGEPVMMGRTQPPPPPKPDGPKKPKRDGMELSVAS